MLDWMHMAALEQDVHLSSAGRRKHHILEGWLVSIQEDIGHELFASLSHAIAQVDRLDFTLRSGVQEGVHHCVCEFLGRFVFNHTLRHTIIFVGLVFLIIRAELTQGQNN